MRAPAFILLLVGWPWPGTSQKPPSTPARPVPTDTVREQWTPSQIQNRPGVAGGLDSPTVIHFPNGRTFHTGLFQVTFWGLLATSRTPYLVLSGRGCTGCDANISVYILSPTGPPSEEGTARRFWISGHETDLETRKLIRTSRGFVGRCLPASSDAFVSYDSILDGAGNWHSGLFIASVVADTIAEELRTPPPPIAATIALVRSRHCRAIPAINQSSEP